MRQIITLICLCTVTVVIGQSYSEDIKRVIDELERTDKVLINSEIKIYESYESKKVVSSFSASLYMVGNNYRNKIKETEVLAIEDMLVTIDHEEKIIQVQKKVILSNRDEKLIRELKEINNNKRSLDVELIDSTVQTRTYQFFCNNEFSVVTVTINVDNNTLSRIEYQYDKEQYPENNYVVVNYLDFDVNPVKTTNILKIDSILIKTGDQFKTTKDYSDYQVVNLYN